MPRRRNTELQNQINRATGIANAGRRAGFSAMNRRQNVLSANRTLNRDRQSQQAGSRYRVTGTVGQRSYRRYDSSRRDPETGFGRTITRVRNILGTRGGTSGVTRSGS